METKMKINEMFSLKDKVAIVTGGARGIGKFLATGLAEAGANIVLASRKLENCQETAEELNKLGVDTLALKCDMLIKEEIETVAEETKSKFGQIDILVNNAGITWGAPTLEFPLDKWEKVFDVNVKGTWILTQKVANIMKKQGGGKIINVSSVLGSRGSDELFHPAVAYNSTKAAVEVLTKNLGVKLAQYNINVNCIAPGFFRTDMMEYIFDPKFEKAKEMVLQQIPAHRIGAEEDIKALGVFLASKASDYMTGAILPIDGGMGAK
jgi:NAD(P)-dependent dehydrogenase (short-subunit alcohol dehydrogenase family)